MLPEAPKKLPGGISSMSHHPKSQECRSYCDGAPEGCAERRASYPAPHRSAESPAQCFCRRYPRPRYCGTRWCRSLSGLRRCRASGSQPGRLFWGRLGIFPEFDMVMAHPVGYHGRRRNITMTPEGVGHHDGVHHGPLMTSSTGCSPGCARRGSRSVRRSWVCPGRCGRL